MKSKTVSHLRRGDRIVMDGAPAEVKSAHFCDGKNEPTQMIGGENFKTTAALRVFLTDGSDFIAHPHALVLMAPSQIND